MYYSLYIYYKKPANFAGNLVFYISMYIHILYFYAHVCCMFLCTCMFYISDLQHICYVWWMCFSTDSRHTYRYKLWFPDFFIYWLYEADFIQGLLKKNEKKLSRFFNFTLHYINDVLSLNILGMVTSLIASGVVVAVIVWWFTATYAISAYHHWCFEFESQSGRGVQHYMIQFVSDLRQVGGFLRILLFPPPIKLTATL
jgi:hypothetical protein